MMFRNLVIATSIGHISDNEEVECLMKCFSNDFLELKTTSHLEQ